MKSVEPLPQPPTVETETGAFCHALASALFPICRSITGAGIRETLGHLQRYLPDLKLHEVPSGTPAFDWTVPDEWTIRDAWIEDESGRRIVDFKSNNLHVLGYSEPVDRWMDLSELEEHLHSLPGQPDAIPYVTSYYSRRWGFCLSHHQRVSLKPGRYRAVVDSDLKPGSLTYGEWILPGESEREILLSTYACHPSMANNELSGPAVTTALALWLASKPRRHTYRIVFIPETIGSIVYISRNLEALRKRVVAGFNITCVGDDRSHSYIPSRKGDTLADRAALQALKEMVPSFVRYTWLDRGSDERQYCSPGVDLPVASLLRTKFGEYPEYHTSLDDLLHVVTPSGLQGGFDVLKRAIEILEANTTPKVTVPCEPQLGKRGLYPTLSTKDTREQVRVLTDLISLCDGTIDLLEIASRLDQTVAHLALLLDPLIENGLVEHSSGPEAFKHEFSRQGG